MTGLGAVTPIGADAPSTWREAVAGESGIDFIRSFDASEFPVRVAAEVKDFDPTQVASPKAARRLDRNVLLSLGAAREAVADAQLDGAYSPDRKKPPHLVDTRSAHRAGIEHEGVGAHPHQDTAEIPAGGGEPAQHGVARRLVIQMHRLRIELGRECDHLAAGHAPRAMLEHAARREVFPMELRHGRAFE